MVYIMEKLKELWDKMTEGCDNVGAVVLTVLVVVGIILFAFAIAFGITAIEACLLMWLWNLVIPALWVAAPKLSFWLSFGLLLICKILFKTVTVTTKNHKD